MLSFFGEERSAYFPQIWLTRNIQIETSQGRLVMNGRFYALVPQ